MLAFERVAHEAATRAGALLRARTGETPTVSYKSEVDLVTATDREAERLIVDVIAGAFPDHAIVAEESGTRPGAGAYCWYVDPLDGTTNFAHGYPHFAVSLALEHDGEPTLALVFDPIRDERFTAVRGKGAHLNGAPIAVSGVDTLDRALLATGFPADRRRHAGFYLAFVHDLLEHGQCVRRSGSAALDLCYVACGRLDAFWEWKLHPWDTAAGRLIVQEAGGTVSDMRGGPHRLTGLETVASNGRLHRQLLEVLGATRRRLEAGPFAPKGAA